MRHHVAAGLVVSFAVGCACGPAVRGGPTADQRIELVDHTVDWDDLAYAPAVKAVLAPAGDAGLFVIDEATRDASRLAVVAESADAGGGFVFALDRSGTLLALDPDGTERARLAVGGDYIRFVPSARELWITQPGAGRIDVVRVADDGTLTLAAPIDVSGGPEGLSFDFERGLAFAHGFAGDALILDISRHVVTHTVSLGCAGAHGIPAVDTKRGFAFFGCRDAEIVAVDVERASVTGRFKQGGGGASLLAYAPAHRQAFLRGDPGEPIVVLDVDDAGALTLAGGRSASASGHCLVVDGTDALWACDAPGGGVLRFDLDVTPTPPD